VNSHVFLSEGCRLIAFCLVTIDGAHVVDYEECSRTEFHRLLQRVRLEEPGWWCRSRNALHGGWQTPFSAGRGPWIPTKRGMLTVKAGHITVNFFCYVSALTLHWIISTVWLHFIKSLSLFIHHNDCTHGTHKMKRIIKTQSKLNRTHKTDNTVNFGKCEQLQCTEVAPNEQ